MMKNMFLAIALLSVTIACSNDESIEMISTEKPLVIEINSDEILHINGKTITFKKLATALEEEIDDKDMNKKVIIKADKNVKMGLIADLQYTLKEMNIKKLKYESL